LYDHIRTLKRKSKNENRHLINSWHKHGKDMFECFVIEYISDINKLSERELFWMKNYNSLNRDFGYNLRLDSSGGMIPSNETRKKLSESGKKRWKSIERRKKNGETTSTFWKNNPEKKTQMSKKLSKLKEKYIFHQYENIGVWGNPIKGILIKTYSSVKQIISNNPDYKWQNIYAVCNGYKPTYMGFIWEKELKI
jgi:hypothetical protein